MILVARVFFFLYKIVVRATVGIAYLIRRRSYCLSRTPTMRDQSKERLHRSYRRNLKLRSRLTDSPSVLLNLNLFGPVLIPMTVKELLLVV